MFVKNKQTNKKPLNQKCPLGNPTYYANIIQGRTPDEKYDFMFYAADGTHLIQKSSWTIDTVFCL